MKQILIEKYINPNKIIPETKMQARVEYWFNEYGDFHSFMGQPAIICYNNNLIAYKSWYKKGKQHRDRNLPALTFYNNNEKITDQSFYKNDKFIKLEQF
jgi:hypothetical protein